MPRPGEIRLFAGNVPPDGWAFCHGQSISISAAPQLFAAIGSRFGGDGQTSFALPDLRGRVPVHRSGSIPLGAEGGAEAVALDRNHIPEHHHAVPVGHIAARDREPAASFLIEVSSAGSQSTAELTTQGETQSTGLGTMHLNIQPYLCLNFIIALGNAGAASSISPFVGEVRIHAGSIVPAGWSRCDGQGLSIRDNIGLYSVIGTTYGGDGRETFMLPDLRGRVAMQSGYREGLTARRLGESGGSAIADLTEDQLPPHTHVVVLPSSEQRADQRSRGASVAYQNGGSADRSNHASGTLQIATGVAGGSGQHSNMQPYLGLTYIISSHGSAPNPA